METGRSNPIAEVVDSILRNPSIPGNLKLFSTILKQIHDQQTNCNDGHGGAVTRGYLGVPSTVFIDAVQPTYEGGRGDKGNGDGSSQPQCPVNATTAIL